MMIKNEHLETFGERFDARVREWQEQNDQRRASDALLIEYDLELQGEHINTKLHQALQKLGPFGEGNREPSFLLRSQEIASVRRIGGEGKHLKLKLKRGSGPGLMDAVGFSLGHWETELAAGDRVDILCTLDENEWQGSKSLQLKITHVAKVGA
jgi:single-stranded-DNA-specific exonuclease